ncbi:MAG: Zn-ribbon domain-containing OB-fold protein [Desulfatiglandales bacterium]
MEYPIPFSRYQEHMREGRFVGLRCGACGSVLFPPRAVCPECGGRDFSETELKGEGIIRTFTVIRVPPEGRKAPYTIVMVELSEGPYVLGNLLGLNPDEVGMELIGKRVLMKPQLVGGDLLLRGEFLVPGFYLV